MNIIQILNRFRTQKDCIAFLEQKRWKGKPRCPYCKSTNAGRNQHRHYCNHCKTSFSVTVGTIFHHTHLPLQKWFLAISLMLNARKGLSALQLSRDIEVNKNTAWRVAMQIRKAMSQKMQRNLLMGIVEMDETYVGGKPRKGKYNSDNPPKRGRGTNKAPVVGAVERGGKVSAEVTKKDKMKGKSLRAFVRRNMDINKTRPITDEYKYKGILTLSLTTINKTRLITDEYKGYLGMSKLVPHNVINHAFQYVNGDIHTNTIEGFWALLKRGMFGQFHSVSKRHLQCYVDEFCYRYNLRKNEPSDMFDMTISRGLMA